MYVAEIVRKRSGAPVLSRKEIDIIGENLVSDFNPDAMHTPQEIDIDLFVQDYLGADQDFQYLSHCGVYLGMTVFNDTDKVFEDGTLLVVFLDGSKIECRSEEA